MKVLFQFLVLVAIFFGTFYSLSHINFMKGLHLEGISRKTENKIGKIIIEGITSENKEVETGSARQVLNELRNRICIANHIAPTDITMHLVRSSEINAFALPGHHIVVYTGLITHCDSVSELCGVLAHEIGHIQLNHVMKRLGSELGIAVLASVATNGNSQVVGRIIKILSSTAFERSQESDADAAGVAYLEKAHINPRGFAALMQKISELHTGTPTELEWISSHPDSKKRAETILSLIDTAIQSYTPAVDEREWEVLKYAAKNED